MKNKNAIEWDTQDVSSVFLQIQDNVARPHFLLSRRFLVLVLLFLSNVNVAFQEFNINMTIIEMTSNKTIKNANATEITQLPEFCWDSKTIALVISTFTYGRLFSFLTGSLISVLGGSTCWAVSMLGGSTAILLHVFTLRHHFYLFLVCRFFNGVFHSFTMASFAEVISNWIPKSERAIAVSISRNGFFIGTSIVHPICGIIASQWGWSMVFYIVGITGSMLSLICLLLVRNHPSEDKWISRGELFYILQETDTTSKPRKAVKNPYKEILTSTPIWAIFSLKFVVACVCTMLVTSLSFFIKDITNKDTKEVAFISSIPNIALIVVFLFAGAMLDFWKNHTDVQPTRMYKTLLGTMFAIQMISFVALTFVGVENLIAIIFLFVLIRALHSFVAIIIDLVSLDVAPNHTGLLSGLSLFWSSAGIAATQMVTGLMTTGHTVDEWNRCFFLSAGILLFGTIIFSLYGSSEAQSWSLSSNLENQSKSPIKHQE